MTSTDTTPNFHPGFSSDLKAADCIPVYLLSCDSIAFEDETYEVIGLRAKTWINSVGFKGGDGAVLLVPDDEGALASVVLGLGPDDIEDQDPLIVGVLPQILPAGDYRLAYGLEEGQKRDRSRDALAFGLGSYRFNRYLKPAARGATLLLDPTLSDDVGELTSIVSSIAFGRDLITTPANDMGPAEIADAAKTLAAAYGAPCTVIEGDDLLTHNFPMVHAVGRASSNAPRLIDFCWGDEEHPKITLVGKGVAFDSGGLDIKSAAGMILMKKDMGGAANVLALASVIMANKLNIRLRVIIPAVENSISGNAFRPGDVLTSRSGRSVEIGNTDAEGRLILADALTLAADEEPDLIIDMATLTGAARVALGTDVPALFSNDHDFGVSLQASSLAAADPLWHMPLWMPYRKMLDSKIADINHISAGGYGGAITAALFLSSFVPKAAKWAHIDLMAYNNAAKPGKHVGGEVQGVRTLYGWMKELYGQSE